MNDEVFISDMRSVLAKMREAGAVDSRSPAQMASNLLLIAHDARNQLVVRNPNARRTLVGLAARCLILAGKLATQEAAREA